MSPRILFTGTLALILFLAACVPDATVPIPTLTSPPATATVIPSTPVPTATTEEQAPTVAPPIETATPRVVALPDPANYTWKLVVSGLEQPTDITGAQDGSGRLFVIEKPGRIRILIGNQLQPGAFLDITDRVGSNSSEQGLLGLAFHPNFAQNGYFFVNYTDRGGNTQIARFTANADLADPRSEKRLLAIPQPFANHNGGAVKFGPDGYLYLGLGDGGSQGDPYDNAQSGNSLLGKILRLDVNQGDPYAIPPDNPYAGSGEVYQEIWASGLRNPWRISFDPLTGDLWIGDVGQGNWEEINRVPGGAPGGYNFGWNEMEGTHPFEGSQQPFFTAPVAEYSHGEGCSVTGGFVYRGAALPEWQGIYFYGDYCSGVVWGLPADGEAVQVAGNASAAVPLFQTGFRITTFGVDDFGELYLSDYTTGAVYRLEKK